MNKGIFRIIIWSVLTIMFLFFGFLGLFKEIKTNSLTKDEKEVLSKIVDIYNSSNYVKELKNTNTITKSSIRGRYLNIKYSNEVVDKTYKIEFKENTLLFEFDANDSNGIVISRILLDSINVLRGRKERETFYTFNLIIEEKFSRDDALNINFGDSKVNIEFKTDMSIILIEEDPILIDDETLKENELKIKDFDFNYLNEYINLTMNKTSNTNTISIIQPYRFDTNTYNLIINILSYILDENELNYFKNNYKEIRNENEIFFSKYTINNIKENNLYKLIIQINNEI